MKTKILCIFLTLGHLAACKTGSSRERSPQASETQTQDSTITFSTVYLVDPSSPSSLNLAEGSDNTSDTFTKTKDAIIATSMEWGPLLAGGVLAIGLLKIHLSDNHTIHRVHSIDEVPNGSLIAKQHSSPTIYTSDFELKKENFIAKGADGAIYNIGNDRVAKVYLSEGGGDAEISTYEKFLKNEKSSSWLTKFYGHKTLSNSNRKVAIFEKMDSDLAVAIRENKIQWTPKISENLLEGFIEISNKGIALRDIKPENFLVKNENGVTSVKYADIGGWRTTPPYEILSPQGALGLSLLELHHGKRLLDTKKEWKENPSSLLEALKKFKDKYASDNEALTKKMAYIESYNKLAHLRTNDVQVTLTNTEDLKLMNEYEAAYNKLTGVDSPREYKINDKIYPTTIQSTYTQQIADVLNDDQALVLMFISTAKKEGDAYDQVFENMILTKISAEHALEKIRELENK